MTVKTVSNTMTGSLQRVVNRIGQLPQQAFDIWLDATPVRSGRARRSTRLRGDTIDANYPYAQRLDDGWSSQSPQGMSRPTDRFIRAQMRRNLRK